MPLPREASSEKKNYLTHIEGVKSYNIDVNDVVLNPGYLTSYKTDQGSLIRTPSHKPIQPINKLSESNY